MGGDKTPLKKWSGLSKLPWKSGANRQNSLEKVERTAKNSLEKWMACAKCLALPAIAAMGVWGHLGRPPRNL